MIILGIDPGTATTGFGLVEENNGKTKLIDYGCIITKPNIPLEYRLEEINKELNKLIETHKPDEMAVEELFFSNNAKTAIAVGQARGVVLLTARQNKVPLAEYTPLQVKNAICGYGGADKKQVQKMVQMLLSMKEIPKPDDAADAIAIAICHCASRKINQMCNK
jgi:crossover junction endodeoxyribonuclease RuvC